VGLRARKILFIPCLALFLTNCAAPQSESPNAEITRERVERFLIKGKTTKEQVIAEFGPPASTTLTNMALPNSVASTVPYETLGYSKIYSTFPVHVVTLMVQLDRRGGVIGYIFSGN
jgi:hypothetical protein